MMAKPVPKLLLGGTQPAQVLLPAWPNGVTIAEL